MNIIRARFFAEREIDDEAGRVRLRYITDVPGQQAVYITKLEQATAYSQAVLVNSSAPVPPYISAEASATGKTALEVTQSILALAAVWNEQIGPAIEGARLGGKASVRVAQTPEAVQTALDAALTSLRAF